MPGAPLYHGTATSTAPQGLGGGARVNTADLTHGTGTNNLTFFVWLFILGILVPSLIIGGLKVGGFQFVFRHR